MSWIRRNRFKGLSASLLLSVFFLSQAFSCCMVNQRLGRLFASLLVHHEAAAPAHACCPASHHGKDAGPRQDGTGNHETGCCIQDANQRVPQLVSESALLPDLLAGQLTTQAFPTVADAESMPLPREIAGSSGPPLYLTTLRLLI